ncbi:MAG TPA: ATP-binding cassette domain-containing protein, partial [Patescibacteria group bacterium]|nr:ATP-binding cassette domain-containing protein [Patescibacteria group bacterium]
MTIPGLPPRTAPPRVPPVAAGFGLGPGTVAPAAGAQPVLEIRDLRAWFDTSEGRIRAVNGISLDLVSGEALAIVGESGSGKSVAMLAVMGLIAPPGRATGSVVFDGRDLLT